MKEYSALLLFLVASSASGVSLFGEKETETKYTDYCNGYECPAYTVLEEFDVSTVTVLYTVHIFCYICHMQTLHQFLFQILASVHINCSWLLRQSILQSSTR